MGNIVGNIASGLGLKQGTRQRAMATAATAKLEKQRKAVAKDNRIAKQQIRERVRRFRSGKLGALGFGETGELGITLGG